MRVLASFLHRMTHKEQLRTALKVQAPDHVPLLDFLFQRPMYETFRQYGSPH
jgi:hypothetical protein